MNYSLECTQRIKALEFNAFSSIEKKVITGKGNNIEKEAVLLLKQIPFYKYEYKDKLKDGVGENYGIIAEELNKILPHYVDMESYDYVPNIMCNSLVESKLGKYRLSFTDSLNLEIKSDKIKIIKKDSTIETNIIKFDDKYIEISNIGLSEGEEVFVYGTYKKCPTVSKQKLFELAMVVTKNLLKRVENIEKRLKQYE